MKEDPEEGKPEVDEESRLEAVAAPPLEAREEPAILVVEEPATAVDREPEPEQIEPSKPEMEGEPEPEEAPEDRIEDRLELDRMEVKPAEEAPREPAEEEEAVIIEPPSPAEEDAGRSGIPAMLARYWIWIVAFLLGLSLVSAALLFLATPEVEQDKAKLGRRVHVVTASLGGEHYVNFNLWGPFRDAEGQEVLKRAMPKIRHDLILSEGRPEVVRSIQENDLYFLERYILDIVSRATGIPAGRLDLKGLSVTRYSDEAEVGEEG